MLMNKEIQSGDFHSVFIKKQLDANWTEINDAQLMEIIQQLLVCQNCSEKANDKSKPGILNPDDLWDVLVLLDSSIPMSALHFLQPPVVTFFTYRMVGREDLCPDSCKFMKEMLSSVCFGKESKFDLLKITDKTKKTRKKFYTVTAFIGTHDGKSSKQKQYNVEAKKIDEKLRLLLEQINVSYDDLTARVWYKKENPDNNCKDEFLHLININNSQDENVSVLKKGINDAIQKVPAYKLPISWVLLYFRIVEMCFKSKQCFVSFTTVLEMWSVQLCGDSDELILALQFFHYCGVLFYFDTLSEYIFTECLWLFTGLKYLISDDVEYSQQNHGAKKALKQEGLLKSEMIEEIKFVVSAVAGNIELDCFVNLLTDLKYIAPVNENYFFPHVLECHEHSKESISNMYGDSNADPLLITFRPGILHPSTFCYLVAYVLTKLPKWKQKKFNSQTRHTFKNLITFSHGPHYICLINEIFHLKVQICNKTGQSNHDNDLPNSVFKIIKKALEEVCKDLCLPFDSCRYGFLCSDCDDKSGKHMMIVNDIEEQNAFCCKTSDHQSLSDRQKLWFRKVSVSNTTIINSNNIKKFLV